MNRTYSAVPTINTSRHPACLRAKAVRQISAFVMLTEFMCENVVGPICPALEQFADEIANLPAHRFAAFSAPTRVFRSRISFHVIFSSVQRPGFQKGLRIFPARDLA